MPDWRNKEDYSFTADLSLDEWAWEFLRRNPLYRQEYEELQNRINALVEIHGSIDKLSCRRLFDIEGACICSPEKKAGDSYYQWNRRCIGQGTEPRIYTLSVWYAGQWGLLGPMIDPDSKKPVNLKFRCDDNYPKLVTFDDCQAYFVDEGYEPSLPYVLVGFNLALDIKKQAQNVTKQLAEIKNNPRNKNIFDSQSKKLRKEYWLEHLRLLDGIHAGKTPIEIGSVMFDYLDDPVDQRNKVYKRQKVAEAYRDKDYIHIPCLQVKHQ